VASPGGCFRFLLSVVAFAGTARQSAAVLPNCKTNCLEKAGLNLWSTTMLRALSVGNETVVTARGTGMRSNDIMPEKERGGPGGGGCRGTITVRSSPRRLADSGTLSSVGVQSTECAGASVQSAGDAAGGSAVVRARADRQHCRTRVQGPTRRHKEPSADPRAPRGSAATGAALFDEAVGKGG
jgi:hypothetical protein